jgi:ABC-type lipopolysaccharide export system ATPase subunit
LRPLAGGATPTRGMALSVADRGYVLDTGKLVAAGRPEQLWSDEEIHRTYLGSGGRFNRDAAP